MEDASVEEGDNNKGSEVAPALIAVHPLEDFIAVAAGAELRVFDLKGDSPVSLRDDANGSSHSDAIRAICFGAKGRLFASAGDDKLVKVWTTDSWQCIRTVCSEKRVSAVAITHDGRFVTFADKFGVVWIIDLDEDENNESSPDRKPVPLLAHYCSIITSREFSPDGRFIISADRDFKIRVTVFPRRPLSGAHEIQSFCLTHSDFVSCLAFVVTPEYPQGFLLSGSGDSTVRLWDFISGCLLDTCKIREKAEFVEANGEEECYPAVTNLCASLDGSMIVVAMQSFPGVMLLSCDLSLKALAVTRVVPIEDGFIPTCLGISYSAENLWLVTGASNLPSSGSLPLACVRAISRLRNRSPDSGELGPVMLKDEYVPGGEKLLEKLQGSVNSSKQEMALAAAAEAVKMAMRNLLIKKQYSTEKREFRKRSRNDRKIKQ